VAALESVKIGAVLAEKKSREASLRKVERDFLFYLKLSCMLLKRKKRRFYEEFVFTNEPLDVSPSTRATPR